MKDSLALVIVTYNRCVDLAVTMSAIAAMASDFDFLVVVDNASTDDTQVVLANLPLEISAKLHILTLPSNTGGAGGFHFGIQKAMQLGADWIWSSDDDAVPQPGCFKELMKQAKNPMHAYGSTAISNASEEGELCWPAPAAPNSPRYQPRLLEKQSECEETELVSTLPFLGLTVSSELVERVGLPNRSYFISGDDFEYCIRLKAAGAKLILVRESVLKHPLIPRYIVDFKVWKIYCLSMPPWRRIYDCRNRLWNSRLERGVLWAALTTLSLGSRLFLTLIMESSKKEQFFAYIKGIWLGWTNYGYSREPRHTEFN
ncbi:hypothetical protein A3709_10930 [Halioglobus sp. HI00S01]|uniref:glycosyltransferase n=1 Tax=Halioglobus sp. HI00S01 TaxID=1822214 RepID=UPI0007C26129|nr:glycosyltransferase [Halioglobus sp. HI00S01]KZX51324.1 hypothetical protein A3709_10930 [Halioglobus sp. HI00S01]